MLLHKINHAVIKLIIISKDAFDPCSISVPGGIEVNLRALSNICFFKV
jgi:hypothetical protein